MAAKILSLNLADRVYKSHYTCDKLEVSSLRHDDGRGVYKQWSEEQMKKAVDAVIISNWSVRRAAVQFNVPNINQRWVTESAEELNLDL